MLEITLFYIGMLLRQVYYQHAILQVLIRTVHISRHARVHSLQLRDSDPGSTEWLES